MKLAEISCEWVLVRWFQGQRSKVRVMSRPVNLQWRRHTFGRYGVEADVLVHLLLKFVNRFTTHITTMCCGHVVLWASSHLDSPTVQMLCRLFLAPVAEAGKCETVNIVRWQYISTIGYWLPVQKTHWNMRFSRTEARLAIATYCFNWVRSIGHVMTLNICRLVGSSSARPIRKIDLYRPMHYRT